MSTQPGGEPSTAELSRRGGSRAIAGERFGLATMVVGALILGAAMIATTTSSPEASCPDGTRLIVRYDLVGGEYVPASVPAGQTPAVSLVGATPTGGAWTATESVAAVVVKGGPGSVSVRLLPPATTGTFTNGELTPFDDGGIPPISNVQFCAPQSVEAATFRSPTTTVPEEKPHRVTLAARICPNYTDIRANRNRNNIQESLDNLGPDTNYTPGEPISPLKENAPPQDACRPLVGWKFQWGTGITGRTPATANLSTVTGQNEIVTTVDQVPELDANGDDTGRTIAGAVTYTLTGQQVLDAPSLRLWVQGGTKAAPLGDGSVSFGALRCAIDNLNGDNVEWVKYPKGARHVFCYAYYVAQRPEPVTITVRKQLTKGTPGGTTFTFGGNTSYEPDGRFTLRPTSTGGSAEIRFIREADVDWVIEEIVPEGWTLTSVTCTRPESGRMPAVNGASVVANLAAGDAVTCTFTNDDIPSPSTTTTAVQAAVLAEATVTADDAATGAGRVLAFTGGSSLPWVVVGIVLLLTGGTMVAVSWQRQRRHGTLSSPQR